MSIDDSSTADRGSALTEGLGLVTDVDAYVARYGFRVEGGHYVTNHPMAAGWICARDDLIRMMRDTVRDAVAAERARCANLCEARVTGGLPLTRASSDFDCEAVACAMAIREA